MCDCLRVKCTASNRHLPSSTMQWSQSGGRSQAELVSELHNNPCKYMTSCLHGEFLPCKNTIKGQQVNSEPDPATRGLWGKMHWASFQVPPTHSHLIHRSKSTWYNWGPLRVWNPEVMLCLIHFWKRCAFYLSLLKSTHQMENLWSCQYSSDPLDDQFNRKD